MSYTNPEAILHPLGQQYGELYREQRGRYLGQIAHYVGLDRAEDMIHTGFLNSMSRGSYKPELGMPLAVWVSRLIKQAGLDDKRSEDAQTAYQEKVFIRELPLATTPTPEEVFLATEASLELHTAISQLLPVKQEATLLKLGGLTEVEIARRLNVPLGTIKTRLRTAQIELRSLLADSMGMAA